MELPEHPFWDFSLGVHGRPGVGEACLALQRGFGLDVNLLFFFCWAGVRRGRPLDRAEVTAALEAVAGWQEEVVRPVWQARWRLKGGFPGFPAERTEALRRALIAVELDAEHTEQLRLAEAVPVEERPGAEDGARLAAAAANLAACLAASLPEGSPGRAARPPETLVGPLGTLLEGVFPGLGAERIRSELLGALRSSG